MRRRPIWQLLAIALTGGLIGGIGLQISVPGLLGRVFVTRSTGAPIAPCITSKVTFLKSRDLGAFSQLGDSVFASPPLGLSRNPAMHQDFAQLRVQGFLADVALQPRYRQSEIDEAAAYHVPIGKWPPVPLVGTVVSDNPGLLEYYQSNWGFRTVNGSALWFQTLKAAHGGLPAAVVPTPVRLGDDSFAFQGFLGPQDGRHERFVAVIVKASTSVLQFSTQGGTALSLDQATALARLAVARAQVACAAQNAAPGGRI